MNIISFKTIPFKDIILILLVCAVIFILIMYVIEIRKAYNRFESIVPTKITTKYGDMSYIEQGEGVPILVSHGICGGYDQGLVSVQNVLGNEAESYRVISPSRFGYPGSDMPIDSTPNEQAQNFKLLLDELGIEKTYVFATSAGGAAAIRFAVDYPERTIGLILLSSGAAVQEDISKIRSAPAFIFNDFVMWISLKLAKPVFLDMFGVSKEDFKMASEQDIKTVNELFDTMLPISNRKKGIANDNKVTNLDMAKNFEEYKIEDMTAPVLILHAKDDPMAKYDNMSQMSKRIKNVHMTIFEKGGHILFGSNDKATQAIKDFIEGNSI